MRIKAFVSLIVGLLIIAWLSCYYDPSAGKLDWTPGTDRRTGTKTRVLLKMDFADDIDPGAILIRKSPNGFKQIGIIISNKSSEDLKDCIIIIDDRFRSYLKDVEQLTASVDSAFPKGKTLRLFKNYDTNDFRVFVDADITMNRRQAYNGLKPEQTMDSRKIPEKLTLQHAAGVIGWDLTQAKNHPAKKGKS